MRADEIDEYWNGAHTIGTLVKEGGILYSSNCGPYDLYLETRADIGDGSFILCSFVNNTADSYTLMTYSNGDNVTINDTIPYGQTVYC